MKIARILLLFPIPVLTMAVEGPSTIDPHLEGTMGPGVSVEFFVARDSHLYFVGCGSDECAAVQTNLKGAIENTIPLPGEKVSAFDVDGDGSLYFLSRDSFLTVFGSNGVIGRTIHIEPKAVTFSLVEDKPMVAHDDNRVRFMDSDNPGFELSEWPRPWRILGHRRDQFMIWRPGESTFIALHPGEEGPSMEQRSIEGALAVTEDSNGHVFVLETEAPGGEAETREYDEHLRSAWVSRYKLPDSFRPKLMAVRNNQLYLTDETGIVAIYPVQRSVPIDGPIELISNLNKVRNASQAAGYQGKIEIKLVVGADGEPQSIKIQSPENLANHPDVLAAIQSLRFRPKVQDGIAASSTIQIEVN
jgi:hypothetical protein